LFCVRGRAIVGALFIALEGVIDKDVQALKRKGNKKPKHKKATCDNPTLG